MASRISLILSEQNPYSWRMHCFLYSFSGLHQLNYTDNTYPRQALKWHEKNMEKQHKKWTQIPRADIDKDK